MHFSHNKCHIFNVTKFCLLIIVCLLTVGGVKAQNISVTQFYLDQYDLTANNKKTEVYDQNGDKCALIRVQTTQKSFHFEVGSAGIQKIDDNHTGEIWLYVPWGIKHISIRHKELGSLPIYYFPIQIERGRTYIMSISSDKVFVNQYDDTRKQTLYVKISYKNPTFILNGVNLAINAQGETEQELAFGTHTYKVEAPGYYAKEGQIMINDSSMSQTLLINDLKPITGELVVNMNPSSAKLLVDGKPVIQSTTLSPYELQIGKHSVVISYYGYKTEKRYVDITENKTTNIQISLSKVAKFSFSSQPGGASIKINKESIGKTPFYKELATGTYNVKASMRGYKDYDKDVALNSSNPNLFIKLKKINNYKNEFYFEGNVCTGLLTSLGVSVGGFINNINIEASYLYGLGKSETIYWNGDGIEPIATEYSPATCIIGKIGYGLPFGTRFRLTPQIGFSFLKIKENVKGNVHVIANGANVSSGLVSLRLSSALINHLALSLTPEYSFVLNKSKGFKSLSKISPKISEWCNGFNVKIGLTVFF